MEEMKHARRVEALPVLRAYSTYIAVEGKRDTQILCGVWEQQRVVHCVRAVCFWAKVSKGIHDHPLDVQPEPPKEE